MTLISKNLIDQFIDLALDELSGDWVIIGGAVPYLLGASERPTLDIDVAGPDHATQGDTLKLMMIAEKLGLPIESINQAGSFFLKRIPNWKQQLIVVRSNQTCTISRPNIELYFKLKLARASESDMTDLMSMWRLESNKEYFRPRLAEICHNTIQSNCEPIKSRLERLRSYVMAE